MLIAIVSLKKLKFNIISKKLKFSLALNLSNSVGSFN